MPVVVSVVLVLVVAPIVAVSWAVLAFPLSLPLCFMVICSKDIWHRGHDGTRVACTRGTGAQGRV